MRIHECPICKGKVGVKKLECRKCHISVEGDFYTTPVLALSEEQQNFVELFLLSSGSLKEMASILDVTYPTVRARLDEIISVLRQEMKARTEYKKQLLEQVEQGKISAEKAAEIIKNL